MIETSNNYFTILKCLLITFLLLFFAIGVLLGRFVFILNIIMGMLLSCTIVFLGKIIYNVLCKNSYIKCTKGCLIILLSLVFITRIAYAFFASSRVTQVSDFQIAINEVSSGIFTDQGMYYVMAPYKMVYPYVLHVLGFSGAQLPIFILHSLVSVLTAYGIYKVAEEISEKTVGLFALFIYLIWPTHLFYLSIFTEEHLAAAVTVWAVYYCVKLFECLSEKKKHDKKMLLLIYSIITGVLCGIDVILKDWGLILITALLVLVPVFFIGNWRVGLLCCLSVVMIMGVRTIIKQSELSLVTVYTNGIEPDNGIYLHMYTSLIPGGTLSHNEEKTDEYIEKYISGGYDLSRLHDEVRKEILKRINEDPKGFVTLLLLKANRSYLAGDQETIGWAFQEYPIQWQEDHCCFISFIQKYNLYYYFGLVFLTIIGIVASRDISGLFLGLIIAGAMASQLFIESQGRYKYSIEPLWCVMAAIGFTYLYNRLNGVVYERNEKSNEYRNRK